MFKRLLFPLAALALSACSTLSMLAGPVPVAAQAAGATVVLSGTKALVLAHLAYQSAGEAALSARRANLLNDAQWHTVQAYDNVAYSYLQKGDAAQTAADRAAAATSALQAIDSLKALLPASLFK